MKHNQICIQKTNIKIFLLMSVLHKAVVGRECEWQQHAEVNVNRGWLWFVV